MDIKCRKTSCKFNHGYTCKAREVNIGSHTECDSFDADSTKPAEDFSKKMFEADAENYKNSRHIRDVKLSCDKCECLFNKEKCCSANGITVIDEGLGKACCSTYIKDEQCFAQYCFYIKTNAQYYKIM